MLFVTWVKKMITWEIIREAEKTVKDIDSDSKYLEFCSFCNANFELFDAISCERVKKVMLQGLVEKFEINKTNVDQVKLQMLVGNDKMPFSDEDLDRIVQGIS